jgi:competence protein ComEA
MDPAASPPAPPSPPPDPPALLTAWPRSAQLTTAFLLGVACTLLGVQVLQSVRWGTRPSELEPRIVVAYRIDLNRADRAELLQVPGLGPALAERIETYRRAHGPFTSVDQLLEVPGIGPATLQRFRPWFRVDPQPSAEPPPVRRSFYPTDADVPEMEQPAPKASTKKEAPSTPIDVNRAGSEELQKLPGIGPVLSQRIIDERGKRPFLSVDELRRVPGIGPKTLEKIRPYVTVGTVASNAE